MPLTEEERQEILARRATAQAPATPGSFSPYPGLEIQGMTVGRTPSIRMGTNEVEVARQKRLMELATPVPTADQRDRITIASEALRKVNAIRETLGIAGNTLSNRQPLTIWKQTPQELQNPFLAPDAKQLRTQFNSAADLLAMLRTGKQGERTQVDRVIAEYNPGNFDDSKTVMNRLDEMENEIRAFGSGKLKSPLDAQRSGTLPQSTPESDPLGLR